MAADREGKPMLTVYFDTGKSEVSNDLSTAASSVKAYLDSNPAATLAVSGYNDPTGNAAANAELSKNRAQSVKAALEKLGIAAERVLLEKPAETDHSVGLSFNLRARRPVHIECTSCAEAAIVRMRREVQSRAVQCSARRLKDQLTGQDLSRITRKEPPRKEAGTPPETAPAARLS